MGDPGGGPPMRLSLEEIGRMATNPVRICEAAGDDEGFRCGAPATVHSHANAWYCAEHDPKRFSQWLKGGRQ